MACYRARLVGRRRVPHIQEIKLELTRRFHHSFEMLEKKANETITSGMPGTSR